MRSATLTLVAASAAVASLAKADSPKPSFTPSSIQGLFVEQFADDSWSERWSPSEAVKEGYQGKETMQYNGQWAVEEATNYPAIEGDKGLVVKTKAAHHAISVPFSRPIDPSEVDKDKDEAFVVQYEVKLQKGLDCGGAYLKLLTESDEGIQAQEFSDKTPYTVMFGPDKCGATQKTHLIIRHKNPKTGEFEEKHLKNPPAPKSDKVTNLYTLIIKPDQTYEIKINDESAKSGSLLEDFQPPFNPPKEIDDPDDTKPEDWIDNPKMIDPEATKPDDWDEDAPIEIPDEDAEKPEGWLDEELPTIPDPDTEKPEEWDDDEDGDWIAPLVPNPKCEDAPGCGPWATPMKPNPEYKGKWFAPFIDNPDYVGPWAPRKIANPDYFKDNEPSKLNKIAGIGIELWTMSDDILFDNFYVGFSPDAAEALAKETFHVKRPIEDTLVAADKKKDEPTDPFAPKAFGEDPVGWIRARLQMFMNVAVVDPVAAFKSMPDIGGGIAVAFISLIGLLGAIISLLIPGPKAAKVDSKKTDAPSKGGEADKAAKNAPVAGKKEEESSAKKRKGKN